jgi:hypothetical protein
VKFRGMQMIMQLQDQLNLKWPWGTTWALTLYSAAVCGICHYLNH